MTEAEAIAILTKQFLSDAGFVARLQRGEGLDDQAVGLVRTALQVLAEMWSGRQIVPKKGVLPLVDVFTPIYQSAARNPDQADEIERLAWDLLTEVERPLAPKEMTEEDAIGIVYGHLTGMYSVSLVLHHHDTLRALGADDSWFEELQQAIDTLAYHWANRAEVPRSPIRLMLDIRSLFQGHAPAYSPSEATKLQLWGDDLVERVRRCLR